MSHTKTLFLSLLSLFFPFFFFPFILPFIKPTLSLQQQQQQLPFSLPQHQQPPLTLTLNHVLHQSSSRYGKALRKKTLSSEFLSSAALASQHHEQHQPTEPSPTKKKSKFQYDPIAQGNGAELGFEHSIKTKKTRRPHSPTTSPRKTDKDSITTVELMSTADHDETDTRPSEITLPDMTDKNTVIGLAKMCYNSYLEVGSADWIDLGEKVLTNSSFGWDEDGLRGYVFSDQTEKLIVIAIKGTSASYAAHLTMETGDSLGIRNVDDKQKEGSGSCTGDETVNIMQGNTVIRDKMNDNLLFSCCCARVDISWRYPVCSCYQNNQQCDQTCLEKSLIFDDSYYQLALELYNATARAYPDSTIWLTGHSLGGGIASLAALTYGVPSVSFESPGALLAAKRLHLPMHPGYDMKTAPHWSIGNTGDPIWMGSCTGPTTACYYAGYAMESKCHIGQRIMYDTVKEKGWWLDIRNHRMRDVIDKVLEPWEFVPQGDFNESCVDCDWWTFV